MYTAYVRSPLFKYSYQSNDYRTVRRLFWIFLPLSIILTVAIVGGFTFAINWILGVGYLKSFILLAIIYVVGAASKD